MSGGFVSPATCRFAKVTALTAAKKARVFLKKIGITPNHQNHRRGTDSISLHNRLQDVQ